MTIAAQTYQGAACEGGITFWECWFNARARLGQCRATEITDFGISETYKTKRELRGNDRVPGEDGLPGQLTSKVWEGRNLLDYPGRNHRRKLLLLAPEGPCHRPAAHDACRSMKEHRLLGANKPEARRAIAPKSKRPRRLLRKERRWQRPTDRHLAGRRDWLAPK